MRTLPFPPLGTSLSRIVLGSTWFKPERFDEVAAILDAFVERGGNAIDTAENYGRGLSEETIGRWLRERGAAGVRPLIISKGGHPYDGIARLTRDDLHADLESSLERLGLDNIDLWMLHRDDPKQPVGQILETVAEVTEGERVRAIAASNWSPERLDEAAAYARDHGLRGCAASSPHLSLARQVAPPWEGGLTAADPAVRVWYADRQMPLFAWSSTAGGYFAGGARQPDATREDAALGTYDSDDNRERYRRAVTVAERLGTAPERVALAWVLSQPFPTFAVLGTSKVEHLDSAIAAAELELTPDDVAWLAYDEAEPNALSA
jgi:aryl-alcohol dehydrogenase-like predicted oxidoreductase